MVDPLILLNNSIKNTAEKGTFFYLSIALLCVQILLGFFYLLWLSCFPELKRKKAKWLGGFYRFCFALDLFLCVSHSLYSSKFQAEIASVCLMCLLKYIALIALYGLVLAHRKVLILREIDEVNAKRALQRKNSVLGNSESLQKSINGAQAQSLIKDRDKACNKLVDVNVAYLRSVIDCLKGKNLTDEEREHINNLEFSLKVPLRNDNESTRKLNGECEYLIKKMTEYGVSV